MPVINVTHWKVQALTTNDELHKFLAKVGEISELVDRRVLNEVDL